MIEMFHKSLIPLTVCWKWNLPTYSINIVIQIVFHRILEKEKQKGKKMEMKFCVKDIILHWRKFSNALTWQNLTSWTIVINVIINCFFTRIQVIVDRANLKYGRKNIHSIVAYFYPIFANCVHVLNDVRSRWEKFIETYKYIRLYI